ncbi:hypothetical protein CHARACLAT_001226 [Characodon lateralis]|uniref:Uncharacterized protein n=1 Tax=Characodon lateralis TaxID=208331 RepID=A0ABU7DEH9_9TELE|nr:hypothetical protein [Characodon lateralis]
MPRWKDVSSDIREAAHHSGNLGFYRKKDYFQVENISDSSQSSQEWTSQQIQPKICWPEIQSTPFHRSSESHRSHDLEEKTQEAFGIALRMGWLST